MAFTTHSKITNAKGRIDYLTNEKRQENIVLVVQSEKSFDDYIEYEKQQKKSVNQAREHIFAIPHEYSNDKEKLKEFIDEVVSKTLPKNTPHLVAVHWNKAKTNFHMHVLYFERQRQTEVEYETYNRDYWIKENGALAIKKSDRFELKHKKGDFKLDENGNKIAKNKPFTNKNPYFKSKEFLQNVQDNFREIMENRGFASHKNRFNQVHIGTFENRNTSKLKAYNSNILKLNKKISEYEHKFGTKKADELALYIKKIPNYTYKLEDIVQNFNDLDKLKTKPTRREPILSSESFLQVNPSDYMNKLPKLDISQNLGKGDLIDTYLYYIQKLDKRIDELNKVKMPNKNKNINR